MSTETTSQIEGTVKPKTVSFYSLLLDAEEGAGVCEQDDMQGFGRREVLLVPDVVEGVGFVVEMEEHPGQVG